MFEICLLTVCVVAEKTKNVGDCSAYLGVPPRFAVHIKQRSSSLQVCSALEW